MGKKKIKLLLFTLFLFSTINLKAQGFTEKLEWKIISNPKFCFENKDSILIWTEQHKNKHSSISYLDFSTGITDILITIEDICSGVICVSIDIFEKNENADTWQLMASSYGTLRSELNIELDTVKKELIFNTINGDSLGVFKIYE